ncbi:hypothetical protein Fcan01_11379 [Folsomia candida]|uniref:Uncharacterized protein n=1 Tax=Folsomia candida TaxID=158441 RepID=A0A226EC14_FOLCA|nr:hypothetical protein Fcan01_11379 [Folsomia candida]
MTEKTEKPSTEEEKPSSDRSCLVFAFILFLLICLLMCHIPWDAADPSGDWNVTLDTLRAEGLQKQAQFLQDNVVTPFINSDLYTLSDQLEEKVPKFVPFQGDVGKVARVVGAPYSFLNYLNSRFRPQKHSRSLHPSPGESNTRPIPRVGHINLDKNWTAPPGLGGPVGLSKPLHIPTLPTIKERRKLIEACSSAWGEQPGEEILYVMANRTAALLHRETSVDKEIGTLCKLAYRNGLELHEKERRRAGGDGMKIHGGEISVSLKNWEDALASIVSKEE